MISQFQYFTAVLFYMSPLYTSRRNAFQIKKNCFNFACSCTSNDYEIIQLLKIIVHPKMEGLTVDLANVTLRHSAKYHYDLNIDINCC